VERLSVRPLTGMVLMTAAVIEVLEKRVGIPLDFVRRVPGGTTCHAEARIEQNGDLAATSRGRGAPRRGYCDTSPVMGRFLRYALCAVQHESLVGHCEPRRRFATSG
jgi:hypothetical protein